MSSKRLKVTYPAPKTAFVYFDPHLFSERVSDQACITHGTT